MAFETTTPKLGDSDNNLLFKIAQHYAALCPESEAPRERDTKHTLLFKWAKALFTCSGAGACSDPAAPSDLSATNPAPETTVTWTDNATNETSYELQYRNLTQGGPFSDIISFPANSTGTVTGVIIVGAADGDNIEIQVRAVDDTCVSAWVSTTAIAIIGI